MQLVRSSMSPTGVMLRLGPGKKWGDVLEYAPPTKYSYPHGQCRSVGVGGYLLGGGVNWLGTYNKVFMDRRNRPCLCHVLKTKERRLIFFSMVMELSIFYK